MALRDDDDRKARPPRDDGEKPSWRELDRKKDRSSHSTADDRDRPAVGGTKAAYLAQRASSQAKVAAAGLFANPARDKAEAAILKVEEPDAVRAAVEAFREKFGGVPRDPDALEKTLRHPDPAVQMEALSALDQLLGEMAPVRKTAMLSALRIFRSTARSMDARKATLQVLKNHGGLERA